MPKPMAAHKEAMVAMRTSEWSRVRTMFMDANTNDKGEKTNLTASQKRGLLANCGDRDRQVWQICSDDN